MLVTKCECKFAGFCSRHGVEKNPKLVDLCQRKRNYFDAWEEGRGPGQRAKPSVQNDDRRRRVMERTAYLHRLIRWVALFAAPNERGVGDTYLRLSQLAGQREIATALAELASRYSCCGKEAVTNLNERWPY